jgi:hypothetical protein
MMKKKSSCIKIRELTQHEYEYIRGRIMFNNILRKGREYYDTHDTQEKEIGST